MTAVEWKFLPLSLYMAHGKGGVVMRTIKIRRGFTLIEVLLTIVILGIMAAMTMISSGQVTDRAEKTACLNNRKVIQKAYLVDKAEHPSERFENAVKDALEKKGSIVYSSDTFCTVSGDCPAHGIITIALSDLTNAYKIETACSVHTEELSDAFIVQISNVLTNLAFSKKINDKIASFEEYFKNVSATGKLDSTGKNYGEKIVAAISEQLGMDLSGYSWQAKKESNGSYSITWTKNAINTLKPGSYVQVSRYNTATNAVIHGKAKIVEQTMKYDIDNKNYKYNILGNFE